VLEVTHQQPPAILSSLVEESSSTGKQVSLAIYGRRTTLWGTIKSNSQVHQQELCARLSLLQMWILNLQQN
jgi:hypothetical protein